jgi:hypothetical protein
MTGWEGIRKDNGKELFRRDCIRKFSYHETLLCHLFPRTLIMDFTLTRMCYGRSNLQPIGKLTYTRRSDGDPEVDRVLTEVVRSKIIHYRQVYPNRPDPVESSGRIYDDFNRLLFLHAHRETSVLTDELPEESGQLRFLPPLP